MTFIDPGTLSANTRTHLPIINEEYTLKPSLNFPELLIVEDKLQDSIQRAGGIIKDTCSKLLTSGGKRLRPLLTLQSAQCFGPLNTSTIQAAVASELIHMASLIHDDIIDRSDFRRGVPTTNSEYDNHIAVLTGDYVFAEAFNILSSEHLLSSMTYLVEAIQAMCDGEIHQAADRFNYKINQSHYFKRIAQKTGILLASCCQSGAATAGARPEEIQCLKEYGLNLGYAYQIVDDILDFTGDSKITGKPVAADLLNGYVTLPVLLLLENPLYGPWAEEILQKKQLCAPDVQRIIQALISSEALDDAFAIALNCVQVAVRALDQLPASPAKNFLTDLTHTVLYRQN